MTKTKTARHVPIEPGSLQSVAALSSSVERGAKPIPKVSRAKVIAPVSPKPSPPEKRQGVGIIKLGDVSTLAAWKSRDGEIEITFNTAKLSPASLRDLERYRLSSSPIEVYLSGDAKPVSCVMIAFDRKAARATFYLTKAVKR